MTTPKFFYYPFAVSGDVSPIPDPTQPSGSISYQQGYGPDYELPLPAGGSAIPIARNTFNQLMNDITTAINNIQTQGIFSWIGASPQSDYPGNYSYPINALCYYNGYIYQSLIANNQDTPGTTGNWLNLSYSGDPIGSFMVWGGATAPAGYLPLDGSIGTVSGNLIMLLTATYPALYAQIGTTWGSGSGTFAVPLMTNRTFIGSGSGATVGTFQGAASVTLTQANLPPGGLSGSTAPAQPIGVTLGSSNINAAGGSGTVTELVINPGSQTTVATVSPGANALICIRYQ